jgi:hypothetical protein
MVEPLMRLLLVIHQILLSGLNMTGISLSGILTPDHFQGTLFNSDDGLELHIVWDKLSAIGFFHSQAFQLPAQRCSL